MSRTSSPAPPGATPALRPVHAWRDALATVAAALVTMWVVATLGLWAAGAGALPSGSFPRVVAATVVMAVGGSVELHGDAGFLAETDAAIDVVPLSVTLAGALVTSAAFLAPLRFRAVADSREMLGRVGRTAALWLLAMLLLALVARHTFRISVGGGIIEDIGEALGATPKVGFSAEIAPTMGFGLLWLLAVLAITFLVSHRAPLPSRLLRFQESVRPPAYAMLLVLLCYVLIALVIGLITAITHGHPAETVAVLLLGLPNLAWMGLGIGMGGSWRGRVAEGIGLPMPRVLGDVLRVPGGGDATLDLGSLAEQDGRAWLLLPLAAVLLLAAGFLAAVHSPARTKHWRHALHMALALGLTTLVIGLLTRVAAHYGLTVIGVGDLGEGLGGDVFLRADFLPLIGYGLLWGLVTGFLGSLMARRVRHRGAVTGDGPTGRDRPPGPDTGRGRP
ncbi:streptophobe family protein [Streptomyces pathocidini]|uniref:streptophobe family protein n=1 Tax=Streptomyces pathocidini TaxID=1650571 RepID=UPI0033FF8C61